MAVIIFASSSCFFIQHNGFILSHLSISTAYVRQKTPPQCKPLWESEVTPVWMHCPFSLVNCTPAEWCAERDLSVPKAASLPFKKFTRFQTNKMTVVLPKHVAFTVLQGGKIDCFRPFSCLPDQSLNDKPFLVFPVLTSKFCSSVGTKIAQDCFEGFPLACVSMNYMQIFYTISDSQGFSSPCIVLEFLEQSA